jgi:hypothetical protein
MKRLYIICRGLLRRTPRVASYGEGFSRSREKSDTLHPYGTPKNKLSQINSLVGCVSARKPNYTKRLFILTHPRVWIFFIWKSLNNGGVRQVVVITEADSCYSKFENENYYYKIYFILKI